MEARRETLKRREPLYGGGPEPVRTLNSLLETWSQLRELGESAGVTFDAPDAGVLAELRQRFEVPTELAFCLRSGYPLEALRCARWRLFPPLEEILDSANRNREWPRRCVPLSSDGDHVWILRESEVFLARIELPLLEPTGEGYYASFEAFLADVVLRLELESLRASSPHGLTRDELDAWMKLHRGRNLESSPLFRDVREPARSEAHSPSASHPHSYAHRSKMILSFAALIGVMAVLMLVAALSHGPRVLGLAVTAVLAGVTTLMLVHCVRLRRKARGG
jgi:hypothetical protein